MQRWRMRTRNYCVVPRSVAVQKQKRPTEWLGVVCGGWDALENQSRPRKSNEFAYTWFLMLLEKLLYGYHGPL